MKQNPTSSTIRLYGLEAESIVDGPGYRTAIFTQGCPHRCPGCHNPDSHNPEAGVLWSLDEVERKFADNPLLAGITLSGGEPFGQPASCVELARRAHRRGLTVWIYSGYTYEELSRMAETSPDTAALLAEADVLVDGPYCQDDRSLDLDFRGSRNQRLIDMRKTQEQGVLALYTPPVW